MTSVVSCDDVVRSGILNEYITKDLTLTIPCVICDAVTFERGRTTLDFGVFIELAKIRQGIVPTIFTIDGSVFGCDQTRAEKPGYFGI